MLAHRLRRWPNIEPTHGQCGDTNNRNPVADAVSHVDNKSEQI